MRYRSIVYLCSIFYNDVYIIAIKNSDMSSIENSNSNSSNSSNSNSSNSNSSEKSADKKFVDVTCAPKKQDTVQNDFSCYSSKSLEKLKTLWNKRHSDKKITETDPRKIWSELKDNMSNVINTVNKIRNKKQYTKL